MSVCHWNIHLYDLQNMLTDLKWVPSWVLTLKGNGTESVISALCTQPFAFPGISRVDNLAHQLLISSGTHDCWVDRGTMGWEVCPTLLHMRKSAPLPLLPPTALSPLSFATMSQSCLTLALPPLVNHAWRLPCHHQSNMINYCLATISQPFALPPVRHCRLLPCHQCLERVVPLSLMF